MQQSNCECEWYHCVHWSIANELKKSKARWAALPEDKKREILEKIRDITENPG